ncbi:MAG: hypothetical protein ACLFWM_09090 [Actinomycetota bacterium]
MTRLGAGMQRLECRRCDAVMVDLDAAGDGSTPVTAPGLFKPARPTIFSVLAEEERERERSIAENVTGEGAGPRFAFRGALRNR